jgi:hypothetical protein
MVARNSNYKVTGPLTRSFSRRPPLELRRPPLGAYSRDVNSTRPSA